MNPSPRHLPFLVPRDEIERRLARLRTAMAAAGLALVWLDHATDRFYYSGSAQEGVLLVPAEGPAVFYVRKSLERAAAESSVEVRPYPGRKGFGARLRELQGKGGRAGLAMDVTSAATYAWLARELPGTEIGDVGTTVRQLRARKSPWEILQIRQAAAQATRIFAEIPQLVRPGMTELELTGAIEGRLRAMGHPGVARTRGAGGLVATIALTSGESSLYPTCFDGSVGSEGPSPSAPPGAGWKKIASGETFLADMVTAAGGYQADHSRTFFVGNRVPEAAERAHGFCREALSRLEEAMRPGASCAEIFRASMAWAAERGEPEGYLGYGENRARFLGHGVGLELDEFPVLAEKFEQPLEPGMILAVEPKAYLAGIGPVGLENTYVITDTGCENLCAAPSEIVTI